MVTAIQAEQAEALAALKTAREMVERPEPMTGARLAQLRGLLEYIEAQVGQIPTLKRRRKETDI